MTLNLSRQTGAFALALCAAALLMANVVGNSVDENGGIGPLLFSLAICGALAAWLFGRVIPRAVEAGPSAAGSRALIMSVLAAVFFPVFWTGLPYVLSPAGIALGIAARRRGAGAAALAAIVVGGLALAGAIGVLIADELDAI